MEQDGGPYVAVRVEPRTWSETGTMGAHGRREMGDLDHCDPTKRDLNEFGTDLEGVDPRDPVACARELVRRTGAIERKNVTRPVAHLLYMASRSYFGDPPDPKKIAAFRDTALAQVRRRWPNQMGSWRLDLDEATPHLDVFLVPMSHRTTKTGKQKIEISYQDAFGGASARLIELQTVLAADFAHLGLKRGRSRTETDARHLSPKEMRNELARAVEEARRDRAAIEAERSAVQAELIAARAEAAAVLEEARGLLAFAREVAELAKSLLPGLMNLMNLGKKSAGSAVAGVGKLFQLLGIDNQTGRDRENE